MFGGTVKDVLKKFFGIRPQANLSLAEDYQKVMSTPEGERVLTDLLKFSTIFDVDYSQKDIYGAGYNEGLRRIGLRILSFINIEVEASKKSQINQDYS